MDDLAELRYFYATMGAGKSTLALQLHHQYNTRGFRTELLTCGDRTDGHVTSRTGLSAPAHTLTPTDSIGELVNTLRAATSEPLRRVIVDEAQFLTPGQVDALAELVDTTGLPVDCFGLLTDFRTRLFPGSARLLEVADRRIETQLEAICWCGRRASHNARIVDGIVVRDGDQVLIGDITATATHYEMLCRPHHRSGEHQPPQQ